MEGTGGRDLVGIDWLHGCRFVRSRGQSNEVILHATTLRFRLFPPSNILAYFSPALKKLIGSAQ
jgi:hypothetical protein